MANKTLKDIKGNVVLPGDKVLLVVKSYGYRKITDADLEEVIYIGPGSYGHEFIYEEEVEEWKKDPKSVVPYRFKNPQLFNLNAYTNNHTRSED